MVPVNMYRTGFTVKTSAEFLERLFERLQMTSIRDVLGAKMSTGMKQKVSIARAMVHDPPVLVFDEATLGLDVLVARNLLAVIRSLREAGKCLIFSTHIMREAERLCDRIAILREGSIVYDDDLDALKDREELKGLTRPPPRVHGHPRADRDRALPPLRRSR